MFSWLKKRCRRKSAPSIAPDSKRMKSSCDMEHDLPVTTENPYFTLESEPEYHIYESNSHLYEDVNYSAIQDMSAAVTSLTSKLMDDFDEDNVWCKRDQMVCPLCRKEQPCDCVTSDFESDSSSSYADVPTSTPFSRFLNGRRSLQSHELFRNTSHVIDLPKHRRPVIRTMSDIQQRPLPAIPIRCRLNEELYSDSDSSGFYETMNSDSDLYEEISSDVTTGFKCTTV